MIERQTEQPAGEELKASGRQPMTVEEEDDIEVLSRGVDERKLVRKLDLHLIPLVTSLYLFSFLDR